MNKIAAVYRQEISVETQAMYLDALSDLSIERLDIAFRRAIRECEFLPKPAEIRRFERAVPVDPARREANYERLKARQLTGHAPKQLRSVLDEKPQTRRREIRQLSESELTARLEELAGQKLRILGAS